MSADADGRSRSAAYSYLVAAIAELKTAQAEEPWSERDESPYFHRSRVPLRTREWLCSPPDQVVDILVALVAPPSRPAAMIAAIDLLGVLAPKETLAEVWRQHGRRITLGGAHDAFVSALRDRGDEGRWVAEAMSAHWATELAEATAPGLSAARMRDLAMSASNPDAVRAVLDREDAPIDLLVSVARSDLALFVADHHRLPVDVVLELARGPDPHVAARAMESPAMPFEHFGEFAAHPSEIVRLAIAERGRHEGDVPHHVLELLAGDPSERVRLMVDAWRQRLASRS